MIQLFVLPSSLSSRKAKAHLIEMGTPFVERDMKRHPITFEELKEMLKLTTDGTDELLARRSHKLQQMKEEGLDLDSMTFRELHQLMCDNPTIIRAPISLASDMMIVGYERTSYNVFKPRALRMKEHQGYLDILRAEEDIRLAEKLEQLEQEEQEEQYEPII